MSSEKIIEVVDMFGLGRMQDYLTMIDELARRKITIKEIREYIEMVNSKPDPVPLFTCPDCGQPANLMEINTTARNQIEGPWRTMISCTNMMGCGWSDLSGRSLSDWVAALQISDEMRRAQNRALICPWCKTAPLSIVPVNIGPSTKVGGKYKSLTYCYDWQNCGYESYSRRTPTEVMRKLIRLQPRPDTTGPEPATREK